MFYNPQKIKVGFLATVGSALSIYMIDTAAYATQLRYDFSIINQNVRGATSDNLGTGFLIVDSDFYNPQISEYSPSDNFLVDFQADIVNAGLFGTQNINLYEPNKFTLFFDETVDDWSNANWSFDWTNERFVSWFSEGWLKVGFYPDGFGNQGEADIQVTNFKEIQVDKKSVPESNTVVGILTVGLSGAALKRTKNKSKKS